MVSSPDKFETRSLWKLDLFPNAGVHQEGQVQPHRDAVGHGRSQTGRVGGSYLETKKVLVRLIEGDITPGSTVKRDFEASVKQGSKRKKIIIKTNLRTEFWRFLRSVSLSFYSFTEEASG